MFAEAADPAAMAQLHTLFEQLSQWAAASAQPEVVQAAGTATQRLEAIILEEDQHAQQTLETLGEAVSAIQAILDQGLSPRDAGLTKWLGLADDEVATIGATSTEADDADHLDRAPADAPTAAADATTTTPAPAALSLNLPPNVDETIFTEFLARQGGVLEEVESHMLALENADDAALASLKRIIHTLKGETGLLGIEAVARLCHTMEDALANRPPHSVVDELLRSKDWMGRLFDAYAGKGPAPEPVEAVLALFNPQAKSAAPAPAPTPNPTPTPTAQSTPASANAAPAPAPAGAELPRIDPQLAVEFVTEAREHLENADAALLEVESDPHNVETLNAVFRSFHTIKGVAGFMGLKDIQSLSHEAETVLDRGRKGTLILAGEALEVIFDATDCMKRLVDRLEDALRHNRAPAHDEALPVLLNRLGELASNATPAPVATPAAPSATPAPAVTAMPPAPAVAPAVVPVTRAPVVAAATDQPVAADEPAPAASPAGRPNRAVQVLETVKVDAARLDRLVDTIGELVIAEAMLSQLVNTDNNANTTQAGTMRAMGQLDKITRELQEMATSLRMVPIRSTFQKMARLARDVAKKLDKRIEFVTTGEDTELDKTVVDRIGDPLVHMIRNAVDHGIESDPADRRAKGKREVGTVALKAYHKGGSICIEITDDGNGLDKQRLLAKAIEKGIVKEGDNLNDQEIYQLIFAPGFSTAKQLTDVSGRGVGMDVVKRNIESLRGKVEIESTVGQGSRFIIRLPLTLAIIEGMVVRVAQQRYIIPTLSIVRMLQPHEHQIKSVLQRGQTLKLGEEIIPVHHLGDLFSIHGAQRDLRQAMVVIVENNERKLGFAIDELLGQQQIVIKSLGETLKGTPGIAGGAIMPDGKVGLIIDVGGLANLAECEPLPLRRAA